MQKLIVAVGLVLALSACPPASEPAAPASAPPPVENAPPAPAAPNTPPAAPVGAAGTATATAAGAADPKAEAEQIFSQRCSVCHGMTGKGDGPGAAALNPKPRNYGDPEWQKKTTDEHIAKTIVEGGQAVGLSPLMVANADLKDKPEVVKELVAKIRSFGAPAK